MNQKGINLQHPFFVENFEQANLSVPSCKIVEAQKLSRLIVKKNLNLRNISKQTNGTKKINQKKNIH